MATGPYLEPKEAGERPKTLITRRQMLIGSAATYLGVPATGFSQAITLAGAAAFVAVKLLEGAISYVGGKLMASALGDPVITDVRAWIENAVAELEAFVSAELKRQLDALVMQQMQADLQGVITNIYQYSSLKPGSRKANADLLHVADTTTATLIPLAQNYDQALFVSTAAMAYRLFALCGRYELDRDPGHITSARGLMDTFLTTSSKIRDRIHHEMLPSTHFTISCSIVGETKYVCTGMRDGNAITRTYTAPETINGRPSFDVMRENIQRAMAPLTDPLQKQADTFIAAANSSIQLTIDCYAKMCRRVGVVYRPPADVHLPPNTKIVAIPDTVVMPGAIIVRK
ncbi:hypothetical protein ELH72_08595 [Rhizobium ruizarguesonis]|jgi:hypothetical protein|uniref:hypothetical protein n=1 Tax=Rhizobium ruizarguesonis TaxID=2081791 RepID=UPI00103048B7|nr:hypothetical protein [Rhizobium ruizarguesonis]TAZ83318.1 hypothetical protein ELH72_08595 [Rhizobium ruizarguesonis]